MQSEKELIIVAGPAGSGKSYRCEQILRERPFFAFIPHDKFIERSEFASETANTFRINLLGTTDKVEIIKILQTDYGLAKTYAEFFIALFASEVRAILSQKAFRPRNILIEVPYCEESIEGILSLARNLGFKTELQRMDKTLDKATIMKRLFERKCRRKESPCQNTSGTNTLPSPTFKGFLFL